MSIMNNVNVSMLAQVAEEAKADKSKVKRTQKVEGEWLLKEGGPQFRAEVTFEGGKIVMESDQPNPARFEELMRKMEEFSILERCVRL